MLGAAFAGEGQLRTRIVRFGQGVKGYAKYWASSYADFVIGDYMTEAVFPSLFHQDPRYFRSGTGSVLGRLGYSMGQIFWTHNDSGKSAFNISEVAGNASAVAVRRLIIKVVATRVPPSKSSARNWASIWLPTS